ncbi:uroporphyrinogen-III synthase [Cricetibacter osteomyelitidis]|uniref:Uroporphyrinogen-III synthase n=1 Tax=Cricetibacter osteomyelitidis TaxID=1521931 RepID=A0A4R2T5Z7_9PAST|nr:uroporphyrinogen-III synthase [Cricetibacter osteomyelitidis]TCP96836.1 uroporphyrinogen-III synthase [Cricetibacter osteomyelitidis]
MGILITRPNEAGITLTEQLNKVGITALHFPLLTVSGGRELNTLPNKINQLKAGDYVMAVSKNAVFYANKTLKDVGFHWRKDLHYFTVGKGTAATFSAATELPTHYPNRQENSEGLLALEKMQSEHVENKTVLILRGNGGRELYQQEMQQRGAKIEIIECYQRLAVIYENNSEQVSLLQRSGINNILITNAESLTYLMDFVPESEHNWLKNCQLITISQRIADMAKMFGWQKIVISPKADNSSLVQTILANQPI